MVLETGALKTGALKTGALEIGVLGCARIVKAALIEPAQAIPVLNIAAIASRSIDKARAFAAAHAIERAYDDYQSLIDDAALRAVYIPLPNNLHFHWALRALAAGKAVLCEKPLASNGEEAAILADAASRSGQVLVEAFHYRYHPMALLIGEIVRSGRLGPLISAQAKLDIPGALVSADDIRFDLALSGGALMDVGAYCVNALRFVVGQEPVVSAASASVVAHQVDGAMRAELTFPGGVRGQLQCSLIAERMASSLEIVGERGRLRARNPFLPHLGNRLETEIDGARTERVFDDQTSYVFQARAFMAAIGGDKSAVLTPAEDGVLNMRLIDEIYRKAGLCPRGAEALNA